MNHNPNGTEYTIINGSHLVWLDWIGEKAKKNNKKKKENRINWTTVQASFVHCIRLRNGISFILLFSSPLFYRRKERESIWSRSLNDPFTTLPFVGVKKYYDGSVALYIYLVCDLAIPKFLSDTINQIRKTYLFFFIFVLFHNHNINIRKRLLVWEKNGLWRWNVPPTHKINKSEVTFVPYYYLDTKSHVMKKQ